MIVSNSYQRNTTAISVVAPSCYAAHLAAAQMGTVMKFEDISLSETSSSHGGITTPGAVPVPPMPKLNPDVAVHVIFFSYQENYKCPVESVEFLWVDASCVFDASCVSYASCFQPREEYTGHLKFSWYHHKQKKKFFMFFSALVVWIKSNR